LPQLLAAGCGGPAASPFPQVDVSGKVTMDGEPLTGVSVYFSSGAGGRAYNLAEDGTFVSDRPLTVSEYQVWISEKRAMPGETELPESELDKVPEAYLSGKSSGLKAIVSEDGENYFEFQLSSNKSGGGMIGENVKGAERIPLK
jgi:hypothetical protein